MRAFDQFDPATRRQINSVIGWLELENPGEAFREWELLPCAVREHPELLELAWLALARQQKWDEALLVAEKLVAIRPDCASSWLHRAYAARRAATGGVLNAWKALHPAIEKFPEEPTVFYNLACYACVLGQMDEARAHLAEARKRGDAKEIDAMARKDADLSALWPELPRPAGIS